MKKILFLLYLFISLWPLRVGFENGGSLAIVHMSILTMLVIFSINSNRGSNRLSIDFDSSLLMLMLIYSMISISVNGIFDSENIFHQQASLIAILIIALPFYISRNINININIQTIVRVTIYGLGLILFWRFFEHYTNGTGIFSGNRMVNQREPVFINYVLLMLIPLIKLEKKSLLRKFFFIVVFFLALITMIFSFSKGAYLLLLIGIIGTLIFYRFNVKAILLFMIIIIIFTYFFDLSIVSRNVELLLTLNENYKTDTSTLVRLETWSWILKQALSDPFLFLFGSGNSIHVYDLYLPVSNLDIHGFVQINTSESQYFDIILRTGFIGLLLQLTIMYRVIFISYMMSRINSMSKLYYRYFALYSLGVLVFCIFEPSLKNPEFGIFFYFMYGVLVKNYNNIIRPLQGSRLKTIEHNPHEVDKKS